MHDNGLREEFLRERRIRRASTKAIKRQQKAEEEKELKSRQETTDPEFAIFVSGYEESHSWKVPTISYLFLCFMLTRFDRL